MERPGRSKLNRSNGTKTTFDFGQIIPVWCDEALPGDTVIMNPTIFARLQTQLKPVMDNMVIDIHFWSIPNRQLWTGADGGGSWEKFCGAQDNPGDSVDFTVPIVGMASNMVAPRYGFFDHIGIPPAYIFNWNSDLPTANLFGRAYRHLWNTWYRDENLQDSVHVDYDDGPDTMTTYNEILPRGKRFDYFTSCLPYPQKGPAVDMPVGTYAPVIADPALGVNAQPSFQTHQGIATGLGLRYEGAGLGQPLMLSAGTAGGAFLGDDMNWDNTALVTDLQASTGATVEALRQSVAVQRLYEKDARGGTRYVEVLKSHFGTAPTDLRLMRPEFLGGGSVKIGVNQVVQTSAFGNSNGLAPDIGDLGAYATAAGSPQGFTKSFQEHCVLLGLVSARADLNYQDGISRMHSRRTRWDYYWPELQGLGEQSVYQKEIYATGGTTADDEIVFGYQERWAEMRYKPSEISGKFRSDDPQSLDIWHLAQDFGPSAPVLDDVFIEENPPVNRILAVTDEPHIMFDAFFNCHWVRPMPVYGVPGLRRL